MAIETEHDDPEAWAIRVAALLSAPRRHLAERHREHLLACLKYDRIDHRALVQAGAASLTLRPEIRDCITHAGENAVMEASVLSDPSLQALMRRAVIADLGIERWLTRLRRALLEMLASGTLDDDMATFACAPAIFGSSAFNNSFGVATMPPR